MLTVAAGIDTLGCFDRLMTAGVPEAQAGIQAELFREQADFQARELQEAIKQYDEARSRELATRGDVHNVLLEVEKVRSELKTDIAKVKYDLLKWQIGLAVGIVTIMATGFGTMGMIMAKGFNRPGF